MNTEATTSVASKLEVAARTAAARERLDVERSRSTAWLHAEQTFEPGNPQRAGLDGAMSARASWERSWVEDSGVVWITEVFGSLAGVDVYVVAVDVEANEFLFAYRVRSDGRQFPVRADHPGWTATEYFTYVAP